MFYKAVTSLKRRTSFGAVCAEVRTNSIVNYFIQYHTYQCHEITRRETVTMQVVFFGVRPDFADDCVREMCSRIDMQTHAWRIPAHLQGLGLGFDL